MSYHSQKSSWIQLESEKIIYFNLAKDYANKDILLTEPCDKYGYDAIACVTTFLNNPNLIANDETMKLAKDSALALRKLNKMKKRLMALYNLDPDFLRNSIIDILEYKV